MSLYFNFLKHLKQNEYGPIKSIKKQDRIILLYYPASKLTISTRKIY